MIICMNWVWKYHLPKKKQPFTKDIYEGWFAMDLAQKIIYLKEKLNKLIESRPSLLDPEVIYVSQLLDDVINEFNDKRKRSRLAS
jgi:hypothetical protein